MPPFGANTPTLDSFLTEIRASIRSKNGHRLTELIHLDFDSLSPERRAPYATLNAELNSTYPVGNDADLVTYCKNELSQEEFGTFSTPVSDSVIHYFRYLRDFTTADNQAKASKIRQLTSQCVIALGDSTYGVMMIPIVLSFSRTLAAIATNLDRNPTLLRQAGPSGADSGDGAPGKVGFVEDAANVLRDAFIKCLAGSPGVPRTSKPGPDDKRIGIYLTANSCLKLLFQCRQLRNAQQMFASIDVQSPPLSFYPAAQRVTYLYYLGRYHFANNHFLRAQAVLQSAYDQCHRQAIQHRRLILLYLTAANICLGRFPSGGLLQRPEASDAGKVFLPLCRIIRTGDIGSFHSYLDLESETGQWLLRKSILLQLRNRCEILVWRSLIRKTFAFQGFFGMEKKVPFLRLSFVQHAATWALQKSQKQTTSIQLGFNHPTPSGDYVDPDFAEMDAAINDTGYDVETGQYYDESIGQHTYSVMSSDDERTPDMFEIESVLLSLIQQGLVRGFAMHANPRLAIPGSQKYGGPLNAGFPAVWSVIQNSQSGGDVPGWVRKENLGSDGGRVIHITGSRPAGS